MERGKRLGVFAILWAAGSPLHAQDVWGQADRETRRLPVSAYGQLPQSVRTDLERRGCTIPQPWLDTVPANVVAGHFRTMAQTDWAVLCSLHRVSTILVYWNGRADSVAALATQPDRQFLQTVAEGRIGFSRALGVLGARFIREHYRAYGGAGQPALDHEGINDAFLEKASVVWYWSQGRWLQLAGAD